MQVFSQKQFRIGLQGGGDNERVPEGESRALLELRSIEDVCRIHADDMPRGIRPNEITRLSLRHACRNLRRNVD